MPHRFKQILEKIASERPQGPAAAFTVFHLISVIEIIAAKPIGRAALAASLNVGEGTVRTIIDRLKSARLIATSRAGCRLTSKGTALWKEYNSAITKARMEKNELSLADYNYAILVKNRLTRVKLGIEQRDAAMIAGAKSATTILCKKKRLVIPSVSDDLAKDYPKAAEQILKLLKPEDNDVVIVGSADTPAKAEYGTLAAAWTLLDS
ncbi:MAG: DUF4443 domain-containing protein [Candidatus Bathyarchaeota archaeon]|jgi:predicted transcriptional regulator|nr:DUF4443 domain-containing protein [Candidatus Bathyarchaeota archaeon]